MKGKEIIDNIVREKMPDREAVREKCVAQDIKTRSAGRGTWAMRAAALAACMAILISTVMVFGREGTYDIFNLKVLFGRGSVGEFINAGLSQDEFTVEEPGSIDEVKKNAAAEQRAEVDIYIDVTDLVPGERDLKKAEEPDILIPEYPVYIDEFPPVIMEAATPGILEKIENRAKENFLSYIELLGYSREETEYKMKDEFSLTALVGGLEMGAGISHVYVFDVETEIKTDIGGGDIESLIEENKYLAAACAFVGINNPLCERTAIYDRYGSLTLNFIIYEASDKKSGASYFNYVELMYAANSDTMWILMMKAERSESEIKSEYITYDAAVKRLLADNKGLSKDDIEACEIVFNRTIAPGYIVPCYKFYLKGGEYKAENITEAASESEPETTAAEPVTADGGETTLPLPDAPASHDELKTAGIYYVAACDLAPYLQ